VDLKDELHGEVFEPLKNQDLFKLPKVDPDTQTVAWPGGADFAPEYLKAFMEAAIVSAISPLIFCGHPHRP
jgi:hypothetical protein